MALKSRIDNHWKDISRKREVVAESLTWSATGRNLQLYSRKFAGSETMRNIVDILADENSNTIDRFKMAQYFVQCLENDPDYNIERFVDYLDNISRKSEDQRRGIYYQKVKIAIMSVQRTREYLEYLQVYNEFKADNSNEAVLAKNVMQKISITIQKMMGEYAV